MAKRYRYNPLTDPWPTRMHRGWASRAQRRHFTKDPKLQKFVGGNDFWSPRMGHGAVSTKLAKLPARLHPKRRGRQS